MAAKEKDTQEELGAAAQDGTSKVKDDEEKEDKEPPGGHTTTSWLMGMMKRSLGLAEKKDYPDQVLPELTLEGVAKYISSEKCKKIITMAGAGISTSAGIPDFRSPGTGLYDNLQKYNLPSPQAIFELDFFKKNPKPFLHLAKELWPGIFKPTCCHYFIRLLQEKGLLLRHYSQNIDTLERVAGVDNDKIVEAHGSFHTAHCTNPDCKQKYTKEWIKEQIFAEEIPRCTKDECTSLVKPDIIFFGEPLPIRFFQCVQQDMEECDLLIIMGTSLVVQPFASITNKVPQSCPRLYINLESAVGGSDPLMAMLGMGHGFRFDEEDNYRDVFWQGTCDEGCLELARQAGWEADLKAMVEREHSVIDAEIQAEKKNVNKIKEEETHVNNIKKESIAKKSKAAESSVEGEDKENAAKSSDTETVKKGTTPLKSESQPVAKGDQASKV